MNDKADTDGSAGSDAEGPEKVWERNRRLRLAELEAARVRGEQLVERFGREKHRERFAVVDRAGVKRRRRRR